MSKIYNILSYVFVVLGFLLLLLEYNLLLLLAPISYLFSKLILSLSQNKNFYFSKFAYDILGLIRLVIIPTLIGISNDRIIDNLPLGHNYFNEAVVYMCIEYIIGSLFILFLSNAFKKSIKKRTSFKLSGSKTYYMIFIITIFVLFITMPGLRQSISFLIIKTNAMGRGTETTSSADVLFRMLLQLALALLFLVVTYLSYKKYKIKPSIVYVILPLIIGLINLGLIVGERRSYQLYTMVAVLTVISLLFTRHKRGINVVVISVGVSVLVLMTLYKELYIFNYSSYSEALKHSKNSNLKLVDTLQSYFYGPSNIAASIDYLNYYSGSFKQFIFDNLRAVFGVNFFVDKHQLITSQLFNRLIYGNKQLTGHLISSAGYGLIYFGPFLFYLNVLFNIFFAFLTEYIIRKSTSLEVIFVGTYIFMRLATNIFSHSIPLITLISSVLIVYSVVIVIGIIIKKFFEKVGIR